MKQKSVVVLNEKGNIHQWRDITGSAIIILIRHGKSDIVLFDKYEYCASSDSNGR